MKKLFSAKNITYISLIFLLIWRLLTSIAIYWRGEIGTPFGIPATPLSDGFKEGISALSPDITGKPNQILNPGYSAAISDSMTELEIYIKLVGGWGVSNAPHITNYLYGTQLAKDVLNKWMNFTGNNNLIIPPLPLPYLLNNSPSLPSWEPHYD